MTVESNQKLSEDTLEAFYASGFHSYDNGNYEQAVHFFRYLTLHDPKSQKSVMGLGASYQMLKEYERAVQAYGFAAVIDENNPYAHFHAYECFRELGMKKEAAEALKSAQKVAKRDAKYTDLIEQLAIIKKRHSGGKSCL